MRLCFLADVCVQAMEVERAMSSELQALKQELQQKGSVNRPQDEELISAMREQVTNSAVCAAKSRNSNIPTLNDRKYLTLPTVLFIFRQDLKLFLYLSRQAVTQDKSGSKSEET